MQRFLPGTVDHRSVMLEDVLNQATHANLGEFARVDCIPEA